MYLALKEPSKNVEDVSIFFFFLSLEENEADITDILKMCVT